MQSSDVGRFTASSRPSKPLATTTSDLRSARKPQLRRRIRNPAFPGAATRDRSRSGGATSFGRRSGPNTPLLKWKLNDAPPASTRSSQEVGGAELGVGVVAPSKLSRVSARRLAAGIWNLRPVSTAGDWLARVDPETIPRHLEIQLHCNPLSVDLHAFKTKKNEYASPVSVLSPKSGDLHKMKHFSGFPNSVMEKATKWDPESSMTVEEVYRFYSHLKLLDEQEVNRGSVVSSLRTELEQARARISELETERQSAKKKLDQFLRRLSEEKAAWRSREHEKVRVVIDEMNNDLKSEKKKRHRLEIVNSRLVDELSEAKLNAKRYLQDYEKERKAREAIEEVCDELANEITEDKADIEALKMEALKIREEVEDEKKMLQMAEVWREERVQMKLIDAKLTLEDKYSELSKLKAELETFMYSWKNAVPGAVIREAELLKEQVDLVSTEGIQEFSYQPPSASEDIYAVFEELQPKQETDEKEIQPCSSYTPMSQTSNMNMASPGTDVFLEQPHEQFENDLVDSNDDLDDDSDWETISHEDKGTSNSHDGSEPSVNGYCKSNDSVCETDWEENEKRKLNNEIIEVFSTNSKQCKKKVSSICRLWRSSMHDATDDLKKVNEVKNGMQSNGTGRMSNATLASNNGEEHKKVSVHIANGRLSNAIISNGALSPDIGFGELGFSPGSMGHCSSPDSLNPNATRGMKGCIEWPRNSQKHSLKSKLMEARAESQKVQLRHVLKQKM